jgi:hypothetical protein
MPLWRVRRFAQLEECLAECRRRVRRVRVADNRHPNRHFNWRHSGSQHLRAGNPYLRRQRLHPHRQHPQIKIGSAVFRTA